MELRYWWLGVITLFVDFQLKPNKRTGLTMAPFRHTMMSRDVINGKLYLAKISLQHVVWLLYVIWWKIRLQLGGNGAILVLE